MDLTSSKKKKKMQWQILTFLPHWGRVTHIFIGTNTNIGSDNGLLPGRRQAIIWTNAGILLIGPLGTNFSGILSEVQTFSFKKNIVCEVAAILPRPQCVKLLMSGSHFLYDAHAPSTGLGFCFLCRSHT